MTGAAPAGTEATSAESDGAPAGGLVLGRYRLLGPVAGHADEDRMVALDTTVDRHVVIKSGPDVARLRREAEALAASSHPGVVRLLDWHADDSAAMLVLEWLDGPDLEAFVAARGGRLDGATAAPILAALAEAVGALHAGGFLHRDLKPANVIMRDGATPVIVDLGAALPIGPPSVPSRQSDLTDGYAAPEQYLSDQPEGPWTDVYGLAAIGHRALVGRPPPSAMVRLDGGATVAAIDAQGDWPLALRRAIDWGLALVPSARPTTVAAWHQAWAGEGVGAPPPEPAEDAPWQPLDDYPPTIRVERRPQAPARATAPRPPPSEAPPRRRRPLWAGLVVLLALAGLLGIAAWYAWPLYERHVKSEWLVDPTGAGDATTIADALMRAGDGAIIRIAPGTYPESLRLVREAHLVAAVPDEPPVIAPEEGSCLEATASAGSISGLVLHGPAAEAAEPPACVIVRGDLTIAESEIAGGAGAAIVVRAGAEPLIRGNRITESAAPGIVVADGARGRIEANTIEAVAGAGIVVRGGAAPEIVDNTIEASGAVVFAEGARGSFEGNRLNGSRGSAIEVLSGAAPVVRDNAIASPAEAGVFVHDQGGGVIEGNRIESSGLSGVVVAAGGGVELSDNQIQGSGEHGILVVEGGRARIAGNQVSDSEGHGIAIAADAEVTLGPNQLDGNDEPQLLDARPASSEAATEETSP